MSISVRVAMVPDNWVEVRRALAQWLVILVMVLITMAFNPRQGVAQSDPRSPTDPSDPIKLLVNKLNDRQVGAALRAQWNIDRAVWNEPVTAIRNGVTVLVTPAHADIHTSIDSAGAIWSPDGPLISASHNPTSARVFIPRGYGNGDRVSTKLSCLRSRCCRARPPSSNLYLRVGRVAGCTIPGVLERARWNALPWDHRRTR